MDTSYKLDTHPVKGRILRSLVPFKVSDAVIIETCSLVIPQISKINYCCYLCGSPVNSSFFSYVHLFISAPLPPFFCDYHQSHPPPWAERAKTLLSLIDQQACAKKAFYPTLILILSILQLTEPEQISSYLSLDLSFEKDLQIEEESLIILKPYLNEKEKERIDILCEKGASTIRKILNANGFSFGSARGVFQIASFLSHSCSPNCRFKTNPSDSTITIYAIKDIQPGDELTITYIPFSTPYELKKDMIKINRGFDCCCEDHEYNKQPTSS